MPLEATLSWGFVCKQGFHTGDQQRSLFCLRGRKKRKQYIKGCPEPEAFTPASPAPRSFPGKHTAQGNEN